MSILITILLGIITAIILLLVLAAVMKKEYNIKRDVIINLPKQQVFDYLKQLKNQDNFNKWVMVDPEMKREFKGTDGTVGFVYGWNGNKQAGEGEQEITAIEEGKKIETEIRFKRPMPATAHANTITEAMSDNHTRVIWNNFGNVKFPMNIMASMIEKMLAKDMEISLSNLKNILEK